jgi:hypothetical protein
MLLQILFDTQVSGLRGFGDGGMEGSTEECFGFGFERT